MEQPYCRPMVKLGRLQIMAHWISNTSTEVCVQEPSKPLEPAATTRLDPKPVAAAGTREIPPRLIAIAHDQHIHHQQRCDCPSQRLQKHTMNNSCWVLPLLLVLHCCCDNFHRCHCRRVVPCVTTQNDNIAVVYNDCGTCLLWR